MGEMIIRSSNIDLNKLYIDFKNQPIVKCIPLSTDMEILYFRGQISNIPIHIQQPLFSRLLIFLIKPAVTIVTFTAWFFRGR